MKNTAALATWVKMKHPTQFDNFPKVIQPQASPDVTKLFVHMHALTSGTGPAGSWPTCLRQRLTLSVSTGESSCWPTRPRTRSGLRGPHRLSTQVAHSKKTRRSLIDIKEAPRLNSIRTSSFSAPTHSNLDLRTSSKLGMSCVEAKTTTVLFFWWHTGLDDHGWYAKGSDVGYTAEQRLRRRLDRVRRQGGKKKEDEHQDPVATRVWTRNPS